MIRSSNGLRLGVTLLLAVFVLVAIGAGRNRQVVPASNGGYILPATQIISWDQTLARFDTRTGAIYQINGGLDNPSARLTWEIRVPAVTTKTSGLLEIQRPTFNDPEATFLVDMVTGDTWILRERASTNRQWMPVEIFRR